MSKGSSTLTNTPLTITSGSNSITFERSTSLTYEVETFLSRFVTAAEMAAAVATLNATIVTNSLTDQAYTDVEVAALELADVVISNLFLAADAVIQAEVDQNTADILAISTTNLTDAILSFITTNHVTTLWSNTQSNQFLTLEGTILTMYEIAENVQWYLTAAGTAETNGVFLIADTPLWPEQLSPIEVCTVFYPVDYTTNVLNNLPWNFYNYRVALSKYRSGVHRNPIVDGDDFWSPTIAGVPFTTDFGTANTYSPASQTYTNLTYTDTGTVTVHWAVSTLTNELYTVDLSEAVTVDPLLNTHVEEITPGYYSISIVTP